VQVKEWMGHSDVKTTMRYLHTKSRSKHADLLDGAFARTIDVAQPQA
jgi:integrase